MKTLLGLLMSLSFASAVHAQQPVPGVVPEPNEIWAADQDDKDFIEAFLNAKRAKLESQGAAGMRLNLRMLRWEMRMKRPAFVLELKDAALEQMAMEAAYQGEEFAFSGPGRWQKLDPEQWERIFEIALKILEIFLKFI